MADSIAVSVYGKLYKSLSPNSKLVWDKKVVDPLKVLFSFGLVTYSMLLGIISPIIAVLVAIVTRSYYWQGLSLAYTLWYIYDWNTPRNGRGRPSKWLRNSYLFTTLFREHLSMKIVKMGTSENLDPNKNYMIGYHPHGNAPIGYFAGLGTEAASYSKHFPHHDSHLFNHAMMLNIPFIREFQIAWGAHTVDRYVLDRVMSRYTCKDNEFEENDKFKEKTRCSLFSIVPGGIDEMMKVRPGILDLTIKNRKGFVKQAIRHGTDLVPAIGFGETELYEIYRPAKGSILYQFQDFFRKYICRFTLNYIIGNGLWPNSWGILPHKRPLTITLGNIVPVKRDPEPASEYVDMVHEKYVSEIERLFNEAKDKYGPPGYKLVLH